MTASTAGVVVVAAAMFALLWEPILRGIGAASIAYHEVYRDRRVAVCRACGGLEDADAEWCSSCGGLVDEVEHADEMDL